MIRLSKNLLEEMERRDYAQLTAQQLRTQQHSNTSTNHSISEVCWLPQLLLLLLLILAGAQLLVTCRISPVCHLCVGSVGGQRYGSCLLYTSDAADE